jgi:glycosyltransferase involved in cell wall biosynthesis
MRVIYVSAEGRMAGAEHSLLLLLRHLRGRIGPTVACPAGSDLLTQCRDEGVACEELPALGRGNALSKRRSLEAALCLRRIARRIRPVIIHANNFHAMVISGLSRGIGGTRLIWHARDLPKAGLLTRWCIARAQGIVAVSKGIEQRLKELGAGREKIEVVYNGIDPVDNGTLPARTGNPNFTFACIGQIVRWKNQGDFLEAARIVHRRLPHARFLLVGSDVFDRRDSYEAQIKARIDSTRMSYVQCIGWQKDMEPIWRETDCLVHCARMEPFGRVLIEAMAHGRPVVAFASGGPAEIVADGQTGLLVPFGHVQALSKAMLRIARDPHLAAAMGRASRQRVLEQFRADKTAEGVMAVYRKALGQNGG